MSDQLTMQQLLDQAAEAGYGGLLPDGEYVLSVGTVNSRAVAKGGQQLGIQFKVVSGPGKGSTWMNQGINPENAKQNAVFFRVMNQLGVGNDVLTQINPSDLSALASYVQQITAGVQFNVTVGHRNWGTNGDKVDNTFNIKGKAGAVGVAVAAPAPVPAPAVVAAPAPVAAPVAAPVPVAAPAAVPVPAPAAVPVPAPIAAVAAAPVPTVADAIAADPDQAAAFAAFLAAQQAQAAPVAAVAVDPATGLPPRPSGI